MIVINMQLVRNVLHRKGKDIELLVNYEPSITLRRRMVEAVIW